MCKQYLKQKKKKKGIGRTLTTFKVYLKKKMGNGRDRARKSSSRVIQPCRIKSTNTPLMFLCKNL